jgi:hypothetical protein
LTIYNPCEELVRGYLEQLRSEFEVMPSSGNRCYVVSPFTRPDGEAIEIAVELMPKGHIRLTDMGDTLGYLYVNGLSLRSSVDSTRGICRRFGISFAGSELTIESETQQDVGEALHRLLQAVLSATDLIQKRRPMARVHFETEVEALIIVSGVVYDTDYAVRGRLSIHSVTFHVNSNRKLLIKPLSVASEPVAFSWAERWAYRFNDIRQQDNSWHCVAVLDDRGDRAQCWSDRAILPIKDYAVLWANKERLSDNLTRVTPPS